MNQHKALSQMLLLDMHPISQTLL